MVKYYLKVFKSHSFVFMFFALVLFALDLGRLASYQGSKTPLDAYLAHNNITTLVVYNAYGLFSLKITNYAKITEDLLVVRIGVRRFLFSYIKFKLVLLLGYFILTLGIPILIFNDIIVSGFFIGYLVALTLLVSLLNEIFFLKIMLSTTSFTPLLTIIPFICMVVLRLFLLTL